MSSNIIRRLQEAARNTTRAEGMIKLVIAVLFVPIPILAGGLGGFWIDYYWLHSLPLLVIVGTLLGTLTGFWGLYGIITFGHKGGGRWTNYPLVWPL